MMNVMVHGLFIGMSSVSVILTKHEEVCVTGSNSDYTVQCNVGRFLVFYHVMHSLVQMKHT